MSEDLATLDPAADDTLEQRLQTIESEHQAVLTVLFARPR